MTLYGLRIITFSCNTICSLLTVTGYRLHLFDRLYLVSPSRRCLCLKCLLCLSHLSLRVAGRTSAILQLLRNLWTQHSDLLLASLHASYARHIALDQWSPNCGPQTHRRPWRLTKRSEGLFCRLKVRSKCFIMYICRLIWHEICLSLMLQQHNVHSAL
jgi:hypothetical protein